MFCPKCGTQNPETGRFCRSCGADLGNVAAALSGNPNNKSKGFGMIEPVQPINLIDRRGRPVNWDSAITKIFTGIAFLVVSIVLGITGIAGGKVWWFWMLIPAFGALGSGVAQIFQLKRSEKQNVNFMPQDTQNSLSSAPPNNALPPTQTDYVAPPKASVYDTGELAERAGSVTEATTRHLEMDSEGETMTLPKK
ncbi:MAG TPA: zinc-ribbon domain-containing protein [Pyrinomonadaceae bacterium]|jgi:hypothetical protein